MGLKQTIQKKNKSINELIAELDDMVSASEDRLSREVVDGFLKKLAREEGLILNSAQNKRLLSTLDNILTQFTRRENSRIISRLVEGIGEVIDINSAYYVEFAAKRQIADIEQQAQSMIRKMLGFSDDGKLIKNGYLDRLYDAPQVKQKVKNLVTNSILRGEGYEQAKTKLRNLIEGNPKQYGAMRGYYRNFAYDAYAEADSITGEVFANSLGLQFAIYEGGIIATTRDFCRSHNGKVYHFTEIERMRPTEAIPDNYDPIRHRGGYGCRHHWNWISDELAVALRPAAKKFIK